MLGPLWVVFGRIDGCSVGLGGKVRSLGPSDNREIPPTNRALFGCRMDFHSHSSSGPRV